MTLDFLHFIVADIHFAIGANDTEELKTLLPSYAPFHVPLYKDKPLTFVAEIKNQAVPFSPEGNELGQFDCGGAIHGVYRTNDGYKIIIHSPEGQVTCAMMCNNGFSRCTLSLFGNQSMQRFGLGNAMMIAFAFSAAAKNVILVHASVVVKENIGYLFLGKSGTGKSTHSKLWLTHIDGTKLLNDDNPAVRITDDGVIKVYGTPWSGKTPCYINEEYPVGAFLRLEQYPENIIRRESAIHAFASVLSSCSVMIWDKPSYGNIIKTVEKTVGKAPVFYLKCLPDKAAALLSYDTIKYRHAEE